MPRPRRSSLLRCGALAIVLGLTPAVGTSGALAQPRGLADQVDDARDRVGDLRDDLEAATAAYEAVWAEVETATVDLDRIERRERELDAEAVALVQRLGDRARTVFKHGSTATLQTLLASGGPGDAVQRAGMIAVLQHREAASLEQALAVRTSLDQTRELADDRLEQHQAELTGHLDAAEADLATLERRAARQRRIDRGEQQGVYACPMRPGTTHFVDSWGAPRSGGRSHKGADVMGPMGAEVYAFTDGVIARHTNGGLGGISFYLQGNDGNLYYYTHLQGYAPLGAVGTRVDAGDLVAYNGNSGNARGGPAHIHFERKPGGGAAVNPYPFLAAACF